MVKTISGLKYDKTLIEAKVGEALVLKMVNVDAMPHNLVIVKPGVVQTVGNASFKMSTIPKLVKRAMCPTCPRFCTTSR